MDAVINPVEEPEERLEGDDYEYEADEEEPKNKFPDLCSKINCDEFAKVWFQPVRPQIDFNTDIHLQSGAVFSIFFGIFYIFWHTGPAKRWPILPVQDRTEIDRIIFLVNWGQTLW